jgi:predicted Fe-Mo cluster-binding NifX family protein
MNVRLKHDVHFTAGIYYNGRVHMNNYSVRLWLMTNSHTATDHNTAFERIKYFVFNELDSTVFINSDHAGMCQRLSTAGFKITTLPGEPVDQLVGIVLHSKLNAITEDRMIVVETEISSAMGENVTYLHSDEERSDDISLPDWCASADLTHSDPILIDGEKVVSIASSTSWRELDLSWSDDSETPANDNTVVFADFKNHDTK